MIDYEEEWLLPLLFRRGGSVFLKASFFAIPPTLLTLLLLVAQDISPAIGEDYNLNNLHTSSLWGVFFSGLAFMIGFRTNLAMNRFWEGSGLLHQMRAEWFDTVSNCVTFSIFAKEQKSDEVCAFRNTLVRLMSLAHGAALEEISGDQFELETIDVLGLNKETLTYLKGGYERYNFNKVEMCLHLVQTLITHALHTGILVVPAPIISRVYQTISRGFVNLLNAKKIKDTKFPFPYSQMIVSALSLLSVITPLIISSIRLHKGIAALATFAPIFVLAGLNRIAIELEDPFGQDANDLPMKGFQLEMDKCLMMLLAPEADIVPSIHRGEQQDFEKLLNDFNGREDEEEEKPLQRGVRRFATQHFLDRSSNSNADLEETDNCSQGSPSPSSSPSSRSRKHKGSWSAFSSRGREFDEGGDGTFSRQVSRDSDNASLATIRYDINGEPESFTDVASNLRYVNNREAELPPGVSIDSSRGSEHKQDVALKLLQASIEVKDGDEVQPCVEKTVEGFAGSSMWWIAALNCEASDLKKPENCSVSASSGNGSTRDE